LGRSARGPVAEIAHQDLVIDSWDVVEDMTKSYMSPCHRRRRSPPSAVPCQCDLRTHRQQHSRLRSGQRGRPPVMATSQWAQKGLEELFGKAAPHH
jgi:hypothetical protein